MGNIFHTNDPVQGVYCNVNFKGIIGSNTRPTPDYRHTIFEIILSEPIQVFGEFTYCVEIWSNSKDDYVEPA